MELSTGVRQMVLTALGWLALGLTAGASYIYYDQSKAAMAWLMGLPPPGTVIASAEPLDATDRPNEKEQLEARLRRAEQRAAAAEAQAKSYADGIAAHNARVKQAEEDAAYQRSRKSSIQWDTQIQASRDGHYYAKARINGAEIDVLIDTGATGVALTWDDARRIGFTPTPSQFTVRTQTANGEGRVAPMTISDIAVGNVSVQNVRAHVAEPGRLGITLLGMAFLGRLSRAEMKNGVLVLQQ